MNEVTRRVPMLVRKSIGGYFFISMMMCEAFA